MVKTIFNFLNSFPIHVKNFRSAPLYTHIIALSLSLSSRCAHLCKNSNEIKFKYTNIPINAHTHTPNTFIQIYARTWTWAPYCTFRYWCCIKCSRCASTNFINNISWKFYRVIQLKMRLISCWKVLQTVVHSFIRWFDFHFCVRTLFESLIFHNLFYILVWWQRWQYIYFTILFSCLQMTLKLCCVCSTLCSFCCCCCCCW